MLRMVNGKKTDNGRWGERREWRDGQDERERHRMCYEN
jgi:hypothetical protein